MLITPILPTVADLVARAIADTDFLGDLSPHHSDLEAVAANAADLAAELWEEAHGMQVNVAIPLALIADARAALIEHGLRLICEEAVTEYARRRDAMDAGDMDAGGNVIPFACYRRA